MVGEGQLELKMSHDYYYQVQGGMAVAKVKWCDFVLWSPGEISVQRIPFNEELWKKMEEKLIDFYLKWMVPELVKMA